MNTKFIFLVLCVASLTSCSTSYKMGQTPDDVYYSPAKPQEEYVTQDNQEERYVSPDRYAQRSAPRYNGYDDYDTYRNDRMLRMSIGNRMRLSSFDDYYWYDGYSNWKYNNYAYNFNTPWNSYYYWNNYYNPYNRFNFYNPYYGNVVIVNPKSPSSPMSRPRSFNPGGYTNNSFSNNNYYLYKNAAPVTGSRPLNNSNTRYNNRNNNSNFGNTMRKIFSAPANGSSDYYSGSSRSNNNNNNSYTPSRNSVSEAPVRTYSPSSSSSGSSSSGSSSSGSSGGVSRPTRGN